MKKKIKLIKYFLIALVILIPIIKILLEAQFGITLISTKRVIGTYIALYSLLLLFAADMIHSKPFILILVIFWVIYGFTLYLGNGLDSKLSNSKEYTSPNNENILIVNTRITWYPHGYIKFSKKVGPFLQKSIKTPKLKGYDRNNNLNYGVSWKDDDTVIVIGKIVAGNVYNLEKAKENYPDKCGYEIIDKELYLNLK